MHPLLADPWVAAQIDAAIAPYRQLWPPEAITAFREEMASTLALHPMASRLLREAMPGEVKDSSGEVGLAGKTPAEAPGPNEQRPAAGGERGTGNR
jgi:hypothetical protein